MTEIINFANASEMVSAIEAANAQVSGMSAAEAAAALGVSQTGQIVSFNVIEGGGAEVIELSAGTASEAFAAYETAGGAISAAGSASQAAEYTANLTEIITNPGAAEEAVAAGGVLTLSLPTWVAAAAPVMGVAIGAGMYEASPIFWQKVSRALLPFCYEGTEVLPVIMDSSKNVYFNGDAMDALKSILDEYGKITLPPNQTTGSALVTGWSDAYLAVTRAVSKIPTEVIFANDTLAQIHSYVSSFNCPVIVDVNIDDVRYEGWSPININFFTNIGIDSTINLDNQGQASAYINCYGRRRNAGDALEILQITFEEGQSLSHRLFLGENSTSVSTIDASGYEYPTGVSDWAGDSVPDYTENGIEVITNPSGTESEPYYPGRLPQDVPNGATSDPIEYPNPVSPSENPAINPYIAPEVNPNLYPEGVPIPESAPRTAPLENPLPSPDPTFDPSVDPSLPQPAPEPAIDPVSPIPSGGISPSYIFPPSGFPSIIPSDASGLIHVYNPTPAEMISFGRWLWVTYADATIDKIWNNPFDGILGAFELYATPTIGAKEYIRSGFLVSDTQAAIVPVRYISINCGSIVIPEIYANYLDYSPYSKAYCYLPFIGIVELDVDDIVGHGVNITYHIDCYNGCCIAQITVAKEDYSNTIYQFSGNCSVEVPLSGGSQAAIKAGLIGAAATGIASVVGGIASIGAGYAAGGVGNIAGGIGSAITHAVSQKSSVQHSGTFGSSYGAMGIKKPYLIIRRPIQKQVINYNNDYGFPAHKRVTIGSCSGFLRVLEVNVVSPLATDAEKKKIEELLKAGVYVT